MNLKAFRLTDAEIEQLEEASIQLDRSKSYIVRSALDYYFNELCENEIALKRLQDPTDKLISSDELLKSLDDDTK